VLFADLHIRIRGASTFGTYSDYSSSLHPVIATAPVRIRIPEEEGLICWMTLCTHPSLVIEHLIT
jgi:hypothetical protein